MSAFNYISPKDANWADRVAQSKRYRIDRFVLHPERWTACPVNGPLPKLKWKRVRFDAAGVATLPNNKQGIYSFFAEPEIAEHAAVRYLLYVGETHSQSLRERVRSYLTESSKQKPRVHIVEMIDRYPDHLWLYYAVVNNMQVEQVENELLAAYLPPFNREFPAVVADLVRGIFS